MITFIKISGFKSFLDFEMTFTPFTVIAGVNASGKSNLFDALQLLSRLAETDLKTAFSDQRGNPSELFTQYDDDSFASKMEFTVEMLVNRKVKDNWGVEAELNSTRLRYKLIIVRKMNTSGIDELLIEHESLEKIKFEDDKWSKVFLPKEAKPLWRSKKAGGSKDPFIQTALKDGVPTIKIRQDGRQGGKATPANVAAQTVLGGVNSVDFPHIFAVKEEMRNWRFLRLDPEDLRQPTRQDIGLRDVITPSGKNLAAALFRITQTDEYSIKEISRKLNSFLPNLTEISVHDDKTNRQYLIKIKGDDGKEFSSRVLSEGTLRLLALCVLEYDDRHTGLLCFEEPENGIHPFRVKAMTQLLIDLSANFLDETAPLRQVIVNTHSPVLVSELIKWHSDRLVCVWLSRLTSRIITITVKVEKKMKNDEMKLQDEERKIKIRVSKMTPIIKESEDNGQLTLFSVSESEHKLTLSEVAKYLQTADAENAIKALQ